MTEQNTKVEGQDQQQNGTDKKKTGMNGPLTRTVTGSILGATVGYLATPENGKKLIGKIDQEKLKNKGKDFGRATKEKSKQAAGSIRTSTANLFKRDKEEDQEKEESNETNETTLASNEAAPTIEAEEQTQSDQEQDSSNEDYNSLKEENESLQNRLSQIEEK